MRRLRSNVSGISRWILPVTALGVVAVGCGDDETTTGPTGPPPKVINVIVDTNRDGILDGDDEEFENEWTADHGASFLANVDDDDLNGVPDAEDEVVNGEYDSWDLAKIQIGAWPQVSDGTIGTLTIDDISMWHVRVHLLTNPDEPNVALWQWAPVAGSVGPCGSGGIPDCQQIPTVQVNTDQIKNGAIFGIEGVRHVGLTSSAGWSGTVQLSFSASQADGTPILTEANPVDGIDWAQTRVAPWLLFGNATVTTRVYSSPADGPLVAGLTEALAAAEVEYVLAHNWGDWWTEDFFETGYSAIPANADPASENPEDSFFIHGMTVAIPRPWGRGDATDVNHPITWLRGNHQGADAAAVMLYDTAWVGTSYDSYGNHDLLPPYVNGAEVYPLGRIIYGTSIRQETQAFYEAQLVQGPPLVVDTSWLAVGHVDEALSYVPANTERGWKLLRSSPDLCRQMMLDWQGQGHGSKLMLEGRMGYVGNTYTNVEVSIDDLLADPDFATWNQSSQANVDAMVDLVVATTGLAPDEIVPMPLFYENVGGGAMLAFHPGTVNSLVVGDYMNVPDPWGPDIDGVDGFKQDLIDRLGTPLNALGSTGEGMTLHFINDWAYHIAMGEVHCATNQEGFPAVQAPWWEGLR